MAVAHGSVYVAPGVDVKSLTDINKLNVEAGLFYVNESVTIKDITASRWSVLCLSTEIRDNTRCHTQIWVPATDVQNNVRMFIRTASASVDLSNYTDYSELITEESLTQKTIINNTGVPVKLQLGGSQPTAEEGEQILWVS